MMKCRRRAGGFVASIALAALAGAAHAGPVTFYFSGTISSVSDSTGLVDTHVSVGDVFSGHYTFDSDASDYNAGTTIAQYASTGAEYEYVAMVGGLTFVRSGLDGFPGIEIVVGDNNPDVDVYSVNGQGSVTPSIDFGDTFVQSGIFLQDSTATALNTTDLPLLPPDLAAFDYNSFSIYGFPSGGGAALFTVEGHVDVLTMVPAPAAAMPLASAGLLCIRRRRSPRAELEA